MVNYLMTVGYSSVVYTKKVMKTAEPAHFPTRPSAVTT